MIVYICTGTEQWSEIFHFVTLCKLISSVLCVSPDRVYALYDFPCSKSAQNLMLSFASCSVLFLVCSCVVSQ